MEDTVVDLTPKVHPLQVWAEHTANTLTETEFELLVRVVLGRQLEKLQAEANSKYGPSIRLSISHTDKLKWEVSCSNSYGKSTGGEMLGEAVRQAIQHKKGEENNKMLLLEPPKNDSIPF
jgi:hypothetical protein